MSATSVSIVIPTYDTANMTLDAARAAVQSVEDRQSCLSIAERSEMDRQDCLSSTVIVVDDASSDGTAELLARELPTVRVVRLEQNRRFAGAANAGVTASTGALVLLLNSDALITPEALTALVSAFTDSRLGIAGARLVDGDGMPQWSGGPVPTLAWLTVLAGGFASLLPRRRRSIGGAPVAWVSGAAMMFRRDVWNAVGPFSEDYRFYAQDLELCLRARDAGWDVRVVDDARVMHIGGATLRDPALLWLDLLTWGRRRHGRAWAALARVLMCIAASIGIVFRRDRRTHASALRQLLVERDQPARQRGR